MRFSPFRFIGSIFRFIWRVLDVIRSSVLNLIILFVLITLGIGLFSGGARKLEEKTALVIDLDGALVEQHVGSARDAITSELRGDKKHSTQLRDILQALDAAGKDPKITSVVLLLDDMNSAGLPMLREVGAALERFKAKGKTVVAWGSSFDQRQYYLAAHANQVYMHPMGAVVITGFGRYRNYYHDALEKIGVTINVMKVGTFKSFAEPFIANGPSEAAAAADKYLLDDLWASYTFDVETARKLPANTIVNGIEQLPELLAKSNNNLAQFALDNKLVDGLKTRDELRAIMQSKGARDPDNKSFRQIDFEDYIALQHDLPVGDAVGVIVASGEISDKMAPPGAIGGLSTANMIRKAREDEQIKAIVLRVDSPGGSAFGSELIRRELELTQKAGKPVVVSMGSVAASGGYWISMSSDEVFADATTVTGSIGVFAILPTAEKAADKLGVHTAGTTTTWLSDAYNPLRPLDPRLQQIIQGSVENIYRDFTSKAALARKTTPEKIDEFAQGRVWTGKQAKDRGLVDTLGNYGDALKSAAKRAKLKDDFRVSYIEAEQSKIDKFLGMFGNAANKILNDQFKLAIVPSGIPSEAATSIARDFLWLNEVNQGSKGFATLTHCLCSAP
jgi:protease IV